MKAAGPSRDEQVRSGPHTAMVVWVDDGRGGRAVRVRALGLRRERDGEQPEKLEEVRGTP
jgi:hypothetical protein